SAASGGGFRARRMASTASSFQSSTALAAPARAARARQSARRTDAARSGFIGKWGRGRLTGAALAGARRGAAASAKWTDGRPCGKAFVAERRLCGANGGKNEAGAREALGLATALIRLGYDEAPVDPGRPHLLAHAARPPDHDAAHPVVLAQTEG